MSAIATFALGIGAATAIFSVAYGVAFRPLPYPAPDRLVRIYESNTATNEPRFYVSEGSFQDCYSLVQRCLSALARLRSRCGACGGRFV